ncbi:MAG: glycosyltransferase family 2 protein [Candidatus Eremiobacteraeota bacterium]|nr:glycosyltransferase family 2 protein [Candidatus Eremiobacteraeota bacterium]
MHYKRPLVSYVLPAFNEASIVEPHLDELCRYAHSLDHSYSFEIIVVNDGSSDETGLLADAFASRHPEVHVHHHLANCGLTRALQTGFDHARGDIIVTLDLDLSYAPHHVGTMLHALEETNAAMVLASPYMRGGQVANVPWMRKQLSVWANRYLSIATGGRIATLTCMVRAYDAAAVRALAFRPDDMDFNHRMTFAALRNHVTVVEAPARLEWRPSGRNDAGQRRSSMRIFSHSWSVLMAGIRYRPSLLFVIPGLVPGLLPLVLALLVLIQPPHGVSAAVTAGTITIQLLSMGFATVLAGSYIRQLRSRSRAQPVFANGKTESNA